MRQPLYPLPSIDQFCPVCPDRPVLQPTGFQIPCLFTLVKAHCPRCGRDFLMQMPHIFGHDTWAMVEPATGEVFSSLPGEWFERMLSWGWRSRHDRPVRITTISRRPVKRPLVVNCIDYYYGHCLGRLSDMPRVLRENPGHDVIAIVQRPVQWMVPDGVAEIWLVDTPLDQGHAFSDSLAAQLGQRIAQYGQCETDGNFTAVDVDIAELTRIKPFDWLAEESLGTPVVTFIVREDRCWLYRARRTPKEEMAVRQADTMNVLAQALLHFIPGIDLAVVGFSQVGRFTTAIRDMRVPPGQTPDEVAWTRRYARSHVVLGVHGSNMLLPAAHAAASIEIVPLEKFVNIANTYQFINREKAVDAVRHHHFLPMSVTLTEVATLIGAVLHFVRALALARQSDNAEPASRRRLHAQYSEVLRFPPPIIVEG